MRGVHLSEVIGGKAVSEHLSACDYAQYAWVARREVFLFFTTRRAIRLAKSRFDTNV